MHIPLSPAMFVSFLSLGAPIVFVVVLMLRGRSGSGNARPGGRHASGGQPDPRFAATPDFGSAPDPRFGGADDSRFAPNPQFGVAGPPLPSMAAASTSVLASGGTSSATGDPFPTTGRAFALLGGQALCGFGILILLLAATPTSHHDAHIGNGSVGLLGFLLAFVGATFHTVATARVQRDMMGGGWNAGFALGYISPQIALYVISPSGISAAAERLNISPVLAMFVIYGLLAADVLLMAAHYFGH